MASGDPRFPFPGKEESRELLKKDPCYGKIRPEDVERVFEDAWNAGEQQADLFLKELAGTADMEEVLKREGFRIEEEDLDYISGSMRYFCDYISEKNMVTVYRKSVELWAESNGMSYENGRNLILAHEFYHYLEWHKIGLTSRRYLVPMLKIGKLELGKTGIAALSEIGANGFANRLYRERPDSFGETVPEEET